MFEDLPSHKLGPLTNPRSHLTNSHVRCVIYADCKEKINWYESLGWPIVTYNDIKFYENGTYDTKIEIGIPGKSTAYTITCIGRIQWSRGTALHFLSPRR